MNKYEKVVNNVPINCIITVYAKLTTDEGESAVVKFTRVVREEITRDYLGKVMGSIVNSYEKDLGHIISYKQSIISAGKKTHRFACGMNC